MNIENNDEEFFNAPISESIDHTLVLHPYKSIDDYI